MKLIVEPDDGWAPLTSAVERARSRIDLVIFRFDAPAFERTLAKAVERGVTVRALVAHTNTHGEKKLRALEDRLLAAGVTLERTADDFVRYHGKLMVVDHRQAFLLGFNYTEHEVRESRSFGVIVTGTTIVQELLRLIAADADRQEYVPRLPNLVISPENSRACLASFITHARRELLVYDPKLSDARMIQLLTRQARAGVHIRVLGDLKNAPREKELLVEDFPGTRLHVRAIIRDGNAAFVGSQSLRSVELDGRREVGIIIRARALVHRLAETFEHDWAATPSGKSKPANVTDKREPAASPS